MTGGRRPSVRLYAYDLEKDVDVLTSGTCGDLLDRAQCDSLAAHSNEQPAGAKSTICSGKRCAPQGCYLFTTGEVWYNSDKSGPCTTDRKCLCGPYQDERYGMLEYLGRHSLDCGAGKVMTEWRMSAPLPAPEGPLLGPRFG